MLSTAGFDARGSLRGQILRLTIGDHTLPFCRAGEAYDGAGAEGRGVLEAAPPELPITLWYWGAAAVPLVVLIVLLAVLHWQPAPAAPSRPARRPAPWCC